MKNKVFISHKNTDTSIAEGVARRVQACGLDVYLDLIDSALDKDGPDLTDYLLSKLDECHQLIAVVSSETKLSWWVPWEIGVGSEKGLHMASYAGEYITLPDYLKKWPVLKSYADVDLYCKYSERNQPYSYNINEAYKTTASALLERKNSAANFHRELKSAVLNRY